MSDTTAAAKRQGEKAGTNRKVHMTTGREGTACGSGGANPAWTTRNPADVTCPKCRRAVRVSHAPAHDPRVEQYIRQENSRRGIW